MRSNYYPIVCKLSDILVDKHGAELLPELRHQIITETDDHFDICFETEIIVSRTKNSCYWKKYNYGLQILFDRKCYRLVNLSTGKELYFYNHQSLFTYFDKAQTD